MYPGDPAILKGLVRFIGDPLSPSTDLTLGDDSIVSIMFRNMIYSLAHGRLHRVLETFTSMLSLHVW